MEENNEEHAPVSTTDLVELLEKQMKKQKKKKKKKDNRKWKIRKQWLIHKFVLLTQEL